jgi:hypothetical protein
LSTVGGPALRHNRKVDQVAHTIYAVDQDPNEVAEPEDPTGPRSD